MIQILSLDSYYSYYCSVGGGVVAAVGVAVAAVVQEDQHEESDTDPSQF